jgi:hypothetical protein
MFELPDVALFQRHLKATAVCRKIAEAFRHPRDGRIAAADTADKPLWKLGPRSDLDAASAERAPLGNQAGD